MSTEQLVRDTLSRYAEQVGPPPDELGPTVAARYRHARKRRAAIVSASLCAALAIAAVPVGLSIGTLDGSAPAQQVGTGIFELATRGSLAEDDQFVEAVRRLPWQDPLGRTPLPDLPEPALDTRRVVFAGEVPGGRWAMVVGTVDDELVAAWFAGSPGAAADALVVQDVPHGISPDRPLAFTRAATGEQALVVIASPGDAVEVSERAELTAAGTVDRDYRPVQAVDGVAVVDVSLLTPSAQTALSVRVLRDSTEVYRSRPELSGSPGFEPPPELVQVRPGATAEDLLRAGTHLALMLEPFALAADEIEAALLWVGDMPSPGGSPAWASVVGVTVPSGAVIVGMEWQVPIDDQGTRGGSRCLLQAYPSGVPAAELLVAARCDIFVSTTPEADLRTLSSLLIVGPNNAVEAQLLGADGNTLGSVPLVDGAGSPTFVDGITTVIALDAAGDVIAEAPVSTYEGGDWGDYGPGPVN